MCKIIMRYIQGSKTCSANKIDYNMRDAIFKSNESRLKLNLARGSFEYFPIKKAFISESQYVAGTLLKTHIARDTGVIYSIYFFSSMPNRTPIKNV